MSYMGCAHESGCGHEFCHAECPDFEEAARAERPVVYLSGPMTGLPELNYPAFNALAAKLRADGLTVLNPAENKPEMIEPTWDDFMELALEQLWKADTLLVLNGWHASKGARREVGEALRCGKTILFAESCPELCLELDALDTVVAAATRGA